jgi:hypothetical protein
MKWAASRLVPCSHHAQVPRAPLLPGPTCRILSRTLASIRRFFSPPKKLRTVWLAQPVASTIWATVAPSGRRTRTSTACCLVPWRGPVVLAGFGRLGIAARSASIAAARPRPSFASQAASRAWAAVRRLSRADAPCWPVEGVPRSSARSPLSPTGSSAVAAGDRVACGGPAHPGSPPTSSPNCGVLGSSRRRRNRRSKWLSVSSRADEGAANSRGDRRPDGVATES